MDYLLFWFYIYVFIHLQQLLVVLLLGMPIILAILFKLKGWWQRGYRIQSTCWLVLGGVIGYLVSIPVVFDLSTPAEPTASVRSDNDDTRMRNNIKVAYGPFPYLPFCWGADIDIPGGIDFYGNEFVWRVYWPVCDIWRQINGYEAPDNWKQISEE